MSKKNIFITTSLIVLVVAVVVGGFFLLKGKTKKEAEKIVQTTTESTEKKRTGLSKEEWKEKYGLDPNDSKTFFEDADGDGVNNFEEYQRGTDYRNPDSK